MLRLSFRKFQPRSFGKAIVHFLYRWYKLAFAFFFLFVLGLGVWQWYYHTTRYAWSEEQKKKFWDEYANEIDFRQVRFDGVIKELDVRADSHTTGRSPERDIFALRKPKAAEPVPEAEAPAAPVSEVPMPPLQD